LLDHAYEAHDEDKAVRPTIIKQGDVWSRRSFKSLLSPAVVATLGPADLAREKARAFDLLDALSRSGTLPIADATLHVVVAATHSFERTLTNTVIQRNVNPIEKIERSVLVAAAAVHGRPVAALVESSQRARLAQLSPSLLDISSTQ